MLTSGKRYERKSISEAPLSREMKLFPTYSKPGMGDSPTSTLTSTAPGAGSGWAHSCPLPAWLRCLWGLVWEFRPIQRQKEMVSCSSKLVYALTCLSPQRTGPLLPSSPAPPSNSGGNKWTIHVKRERVSWGAGGGGGDATDKLH